MTKQFHAFVGINMIWTKLSEYCIKSGDWTIAKYINDGEVKYGLYRLNDLKGFYSTADDAKAQAND
jgi:hypothetical protein